MPGPVSHVSDQLPAFPLRVPQLFIHQPDQQMHQVNVLPFVISAYIIGVSVFSLMIDHINGPGVIFYKEPVAHVFSFAIYRQRFFIPDIIDH
ncbi:hypothetical protein FQZ97_1210370 [compost metagenome]